MLRNVKTETIHREVFLMKKRCCLGLMYGVCIALCIGLAIPALTEENAEEGKAQERIQTELKAQQERAEQTKCPMSGNPVAEGQGFVYNGYMLKTCCPNCARGVEKDPVSAIQKIRANGEEPQLAEGYALQDRCPMSGKPVKDDIFMVIDNQLVKFCCPGCPRGFEEDPKGVLMKMSESKQAPIILTLAQETCPVSGHAISGNISVEHEGKIVELCCEGCKGQFNENPEKFMKQLSSEGVYLKPAQ
jgi:YHS domain-containing protein